MINILLIEPDKEQAQVLADQLKTEHCHVIPGANLQGLIAILSQRHFDILLADIDTTSEGEDLLEVCRQLKQDQRFAPIPIIAIVDRGSTGKIIRALETGVDHFLVKPFEADYVINRIHDFLASAGLRAQGKKCVELEHINFLMNFICAAQRENFFRLAEAIFNLEVMAKIKDIIIGESIFPYLFKRLHEMLEEEYAFMRQTQFADMRISLVGVEGITRHLPVQELMAGFRQYFYIFFKLVHALTSDILFGRPVRILLVEDNPGDIRLVQEALKESRLPLKLDFVTDGEEAMSHLKREGRYVETIKPDLILLDLNLPKKDGREVLKEVKQDPNLSDIPVVIMTVSREDYEYLRSQGLEVERYIVKPFDLKQFVEVIRSIQERWFDAVKIFI